MLCQCERESSDENCKGPFTVRREGLIISPVCHCLIKRGTTLSDNTPLKSLGHKLLMMQAHCLAIFLRCSKKKSLDLDVFINSCCGHIPAQISKGLKIQLLHLLLAEPVADSPAFQEGLHLHCAPGPSLEANAAD